MAGVGVFPGSFNPPTVAHLSMAAAVLQHFDLTRLDLVVSRAPLAKEHVTHPLFEHQVEMLHRSVAPWAGLRAVVTERRLLVDVAEGYDLMVLGADKWHQIQELKWYDSTADRDRAMARLPELVVFPRQGSPSPPPDILMDDSLLPDGIDSVSSSRARAGETQLMTPEARSFAERSGAWIDVDRYDLWLAESGPDPAAD